MVKKKTNKRKKKTMKQTKPKRPKTENKTFLGVEPRTYNIQDYPLDECVISPSVKHFN